jgi:hypothetical protein
MGRGAQKRPPVDEIISTLQKQKIYDMEDILTFITSF